MSQTEITTEDTHVNNTAIVVDGIEHATSTESHSSELVPHEAGLYAEEIGHIGNFPITNALFTGWLSVGVILILAIIIRLKIKEVPKGIQNFFEYVVDGAMSLADQVTGDRKITEKAFPFIFPIFMFVLINNWFGIMPLGGFGIIHVTEHGNAFIPLIRSATADINGTVALAIFSVIGANIFGAIFIGIWKMFNKYVNLKALGGVVTKVRKDPMVLLTAPIMVFVSALEIVGEIAKVASLSFRLFGNVFAGEVLLASMAALMSYILPTPFLILEVFVGIIQAFIFAILTLVYYTIAAQDHDHDEEHEHKPHHEAEVSAV